MQNKCKYDIMYLILYHAHSGATVTRIRKETAQNLSHLDKLLDYLQGMKMIDYDEQDEIYKTTDAGREFMHSYVQMMRTLPYKENRIFAIQNPLLGR